MLYPTLLHDQTQRSGDQTQIQHNLYSIFGKNLGPEPTKGSWHTLTAKKQSDVCSIKGRPSERVCAPKPWNHCLNPERVDAEDHQVQVGRLAACL